MLGDSLSAEYGLKRGTGWVALLEQRLAAREDRRASVVNASISGDTTSGGRSRLPALLAQHQPRHVVIELGGNDALRGLPLAHDRGQPGLDDAGRAEGRRQGAAGRHAGAAQLRRRLRASVLPPCSRKVASEHKAALVPFLLKGVADGPDPRACSRPTASTRTREAHPLMLDNVWPELKKLLK